MQAYLVKKPSVDEAMSDAAKAIAKAAKTVDSKPVDFMLALADVRKNLISAIATDAEKKPIEYIVKFVDRLDCHVLAYDATLRCALMTADIGSAYGTQTVRMLAKLALQIGRGIEEIRDYCATHHLRDARERQNAALRLIHESDKSKRLLKQQAAIAEMMRRHSLNLARTKTDIIEEMANEKESGKLKWGSRKTLLGYCKGISVTR